VLPLNKKFFLEKVVVIVRNATVVNDKDCNMKLSWIATIFLWWLLFLLILVRTKSLVTRKLLHEFFMSKLLMLRKCQREKKKSHTLVFNNHQKNSFLFVRFIWWVEFHQEEKRTAESAFVSQTNDGTINWHLKLLSFLFSVHPSEDLKAI
jgi:hypothetical protein